MKARIMNGSTYVTTMMTNEMTYATTAINAMLPITAPITIITLRIIIFYRIQIYVHRMYA